MSAYGTEAVAPVGVVPTFFSKLQLQERPRETSNSEFSILGDFCQILHVHLKPNQSVQVEPGTMCYMVCVLLLFIVLLKVRCN